MNEGVALTSTDRASLMQKLASRDGNGGAKPVVATPFAPAVPGGAPLVGAFPGAPLQVKIPPTASMVPPPQLGVQPTSQFMLKNMFNPATETDENWELDIQEEVLEECSKYGPVMHIFVDKNSMGHVYVLTLDFGSRVAVGNRWCGLLGSNMLSCWLTLAPSTDT